MMVNEARARAVAALPSEVATTFHAMPDNGDAMLVTSIIASTGRDAITTRQHLTTLCAKGLVSCTDDKCHRTQQRGRRV